MGKNVWKIREILLHPTRTRVTANTRRRYINTFFAGSFLWVGFSFTISLRYSYRRESTGFASPDRSAW